MPDICEVLHIKLNSDNNFVAVVGLTQDYEQILKLLDLNLELEVCSTTLSKACPFKVKCLCFDELQSLVIVTGGI